jgi:hypothetical protein
MKLVLKFALLVLLTKFMVSTPQGVHPELDAIKQLTVSDMAQQFNTVLVIAEKILASLR